jgi:hypothetical protein
MTKVEMIEYLATASETHVGREAMGVSSETCAAFRRGEDGGTTLEQRNAMFAAVMSALRARRLV